MEEKVCKWLKEQMAKSPFAESMGMTLLDIAPGYAKAEARYSEEMCNLNGLIHGGAIFALIDGVLGAAASSCGTMVTGLNINVTFTRPPSIGSTVIAEAREQSRSKYTANYHIEVRQRSENEDKLIALCQAVVPLRTES
jgi:acyl-CoA thioesterase